MENEIENNELRNGLAVSNVSKSEQTACETEVTSEQKEASDKISIDDIEYPVMEEFSDIFDKDVVAYLSKKNIKKPTLVQQQAIPVLLTGKNLFFTSLTGTGKTFTYLLPIIKMLDKDIKSPQALIVAPTQDLAVQIYNVAKELMQAININPPLLATGGTSLNRQIEATKNKPPIVVGTISRIVQLNKMKKLKLHEVRTIVFDECDKMLDLLNFEESKELTKKCLKDTKLWFTSASLGNDTLSNIKILRPDATVLEIKKNRIPQRIKHYYLVCEHRKKPDVLRAAFRATKEDRALVFVNKDVEITGMSAKLNHHDVEASFIDGECKGFERKKALDDFKSSRIKLLVASDLASRGLDIEDLKCVINYSAPKTYEQYLHRAGRCGRGENDGIVVTICTTQDEPYIRKYQKRLGIRIQKSMLYEGEIVPFVKKKKTDKPYKKSEKALGAEKTYKKTDKTYKK